MAHKKYDPTIKKEIINAIVNGGKSSAHTAIGYDIPVTVVYS